MRLTRDWGSQLYGPLPKKVMKVVCYEWFDVRFFMAGLVTLPILERLTGAVPSRTNRTGTYPWNGADRGSDRRYFW